MTRQQMLQIDKTTLSIDGQTGKTVALPYSLKTPGNQRLH